MNLAIFVAWLHVTLGASKCFLHCLTVFTENKVIDVETGESFRSVWFLCSRKITNFAASWDK